MKNSQRALSFSNILMESGSNDVKDESYTVWYINSLTLQSMIQSNCMVWLYDTKKVISY